jgi:oligopeptide transport system permease protein
MLRFFLKRLLISIPTLFCVIAIVFFTVHLSPGNPFSGEKALSPEAMQTLLHRFHLDIPVWKQFILYINNLLHGSFGESYKFLGQSVNDLIFPNNMGGFWVTLRLGVYSMAAAIPLGILFGFYAGLRKDSFFDKTIITGNIFFTTVPTMVTGPLLVLLFSITLGWLPSGGWGNGNFNHLFLPTLVLTLSFLPTIAFVARGSIIEVLNTDFIRTARAKGLSSRQILFKHAIRPALIPVVSLLGPLFAGILAGTIVTERVFALPGLGILTTNAAMSRDYNLVMGITIFGSFLTIFFNLLVDLCYSFLDPKIKQ